MANENFRVESKGNVHQNGCKTSFKLFKRDGGAFMFAGQFYAMGWNRTDEQCIAEATRQIAKDDAE